MSLTYQKCHCMQYGHFACHQLSEWIGIQVPVFRRMEIEHHAKHLGVVIDHTLCTYAQGHVSRVRGSRWLAIFILRTPCFIRRRLLTQFLTYFILHLILDLSFFPHMEITCAIHGEGHLPPSTGYEPNNLTVENNSEMAPTLFQGGSACSASTLLPHPWGRTVMTHKLWECWLHHCTHRREKQVQTRHESITLLEKVLCQVRHLFD